MTNEAIAEKAQSKIVEILKQEASNYHKQVDIRLAILSAIQEASKAKDAEIERLGAALDKAIKALRTLPEDTFGYDSCGDGPGEYQWPMINQLIDELEKDREPQEKT